MKFDFILILVASIVELFFVITFVAVYFSPISKS